MDHYPLCVRWGLSTVVVAEVWVVQEMVTYREGVSSFGDHCGVLDTTCVSGRRGGDAQPY